MARKNKNHRHKKVDKKEEKLPTAAATLQVPVSLKNFRILIISILGITALAFYPSISNEFIFWDDPEYILNNPHIKEINLKNLFGEFYFGNYHPLTMLSYSLEYAAFEFNPKAFHFNNVLLHLLNTFLVFVFIYYLLGRRRIEVAAITAVLFGIHPMHVESVSWVSERKDVLFTFFFLLSLIWYLKYWGQGTGSKGLKKDYLLVFVFFLCSLFSKAPAVVLPVVLLLIDYFLGRKIDRKAVLEKVPFFALSIVFGIVAIEAQKTEAAINPDYYKGAKSIFWGCYSLFLYLYKAVLPINLSGVHPYPVTEDREMPTYLYSSILIIPAIIFLIRKSLRFGKEILFGFAFFLITIFLVLKFIPVGDAIMAERYTYIPYIGLFFIVGTGYEKLIQKLDKFRKPAIFGVVGVVLLLSFFTWNRTQVWQTTFSFWTDVANKKPNYWRAWNNIGQHYYQIGDYQKAVENYTKAMEVDKWCPPVPYMWRGVVYLEHLKEVDKAISDFQKVLTFPNPADPTQIDGRQNLGLAYYRKGDYDNAIKYYNEVLQRQPNRAKAYYLRGLVYGAKGENKNAVNDYSAAIQLQPNYEQAYLNRGALYTDKIAKYDLAVADFKNALRLNPNNIDAAVNIGLALYKKGDYNEAVQQLSSILSQTQNGRAYYFRALAYAAKNDFQSALKDGQKAKELGVGVSDAQLQQWGNK
ncbi:MAG: hypothetical protein COA57_09320 [Flavobacteriales bacterium]|nr:MAG: hypothetical protein COA57_09320 [Flavobacteriales bacterium]